MGRITARPSCLLLCIACTIALATAGCNQSSTSAGGGKKRIVLLINTSSPYWETGRKGMELAAKELKLADAGFEAVFEVNDGTEQGQIDKLRQFGTEKDIVAIAVSPVKADNLAIVDEMKKMKKNGVHVICMDGDVDRANIATLAKRILAPTISKPVRFSASRPRNCSTIGKRRTKDTSISSATRRPKTRSTAWTASRKPWVRTTFTRNSIGWKTIPIFPGRRRMCRTALQQYPDLQALLGIWSYNAPAIADVVEHEYASRRASLTIATFDGETGAINQMGKGNIDVMVVQDPYDICNESVRLLYAMVKDDSATVKKMLPNQGKDGGDIYDTAIRVVVPEGKTPLTADVFKEFGDAVRFFTLPEFNGWLKEPQA